LCYYVLLLSSFVFDRIITLEDVLEALLQEQIYDEMDAAGRGTTASRSSDEPVAPLSVVQEQSSFELEMNSTGAGRPMRRAASPLPEDDSYRLM
jgi:hypothetical protein